MPELVNQCPLCCGEHSRLFDQRSFRGKTISNRLCPQCGLVFQSPRMSAAEADEFYAAEYRRMYQGNEDPVRKDLSVQRERAVSLLNFLRGKVERIGRHLDIGSSAGLLLQEIQKEYACQPVGVEPGIAYRTYARNQGLTVYASLDELKQQEKTGFDLISMSHVLEHLPDPVAYLASLGQSLLNPGGWLLLEVPNLYAHDSFEIAHLASFSPGTLAAVVQKAGYEIVHMERHGRPRSELIPFFLTVLARCRPETQPAPTLRSERMVALKRQAGLLRRRFLLHLFPKRAWKEL